jgi:hypothetical protein
VLARSTAEGLTLVRDSGTEAATLVINSDSSYCSACGGGAEMNEDAHLTLLPRELAGGYVPLPEGQRAGCGATFTASATDSFMPGIGELIRQTRPDLPFIGVHGVEGRA